MKKWISTGLVSLAILTLLSGCIGLQFGGGSRPVPPPVQTVPTLGQQLSDLKMARDRGALSEADYEIQKAKLLGK